MKPEKRKYYRIAIWVYFVLIFILAVLDINGTGSKLNNTYLLSIRLDYLTHFGLFIPLMWLIWSVYEVSFRKDFTNAIFWMFIGLVLAWLSEGIQYFIPYRAFNINDLVANTIGVLLGAGFFLIPINNRKSVESLNVEKFKL